MKKILTSILLALFVVSAFYAEQITEGDKAFFQQIRTAVQTADTSAFAGLLLYPMQIKTAKGELVLKSANDAVKKYEMIATKRVKSAVEQQEPGEMMKSWRGVMIGQGEIWFDRVKPEGTSEFRYRITAINPD